MDLRVNSAGKDQLAGMVRDVCRIRPFDSDINDLAAVNAEIAISMNAACADNISMKRQIHIALAPLSALARITPKTGPNTKQLAFGCIEKKSQIDYSYIEKPFCFFGDWGKFSLCLPLRSCFRLISESILRERSSQFRLCSDYSAERVSLAGQQHHVEKFVNCANGRTASPHCPWTVVRTGMHCRFRLSVGFGKVFGIKGMDQAKFQDWMSAADCLTDAPSA